MKKKELLKGFSLIEMLVVIAIIGIMIGVAVVGVNNQKRNALRNDAEKIYNFLKTTQSQSTKFSPIILNNNNKVDIGNLINNNPANHFFELRAYRFVVFDNNGNVNLQLMNSFNEVNRNTRITIVGTNDQNVNTQPRFDILQNNSNPISTFAVILFVNDNQIQRFPIGFRTDGRVALPNNIPNIRIRVSMQGVNRRHFVELTNNEVRIELYSN